MLQAGSWSPTAHSEGSFHVFVLQVKGLEFNSFSPNLLASGAADGELCIWDVANPAQPSLYPALKVGPTGLAEALAWLKCTISKPEAFII